MTMMTPAKRMIEDEDMEQPEEIETNQDEREIEAGDLETKEHEHTNTRPRRANARKGVDCLKIKLRGGNMTLNSPPALEKRKNILCMTCTN